jgi:ribosome-associated protein
VQSGGEAKHLIQSGEVQVNGVTETRRGRKLAVGDRVSTMGKTFKVELPVA